MSCYQNREMEPTRWSKLGGPLLHLGIAIMRSPRSENKFREDHSMGRVDNVQYIGAGSILTYGYKKITLIEGDPGAGKTTLTSKLCKQWAEGKIQVFENDLVFFIRLRDSCYHNIKGLNELFDKLNCPNMLEYAQLHNGNGLVCILDG